MCAIFLNFNLLFMAVLALCCCDNLFSSCDVQASHCGGFSWTHGLRSCGTQVSCPMACGLLLEQGSNQCPLHWQADSQPLDH